MKRLLLAVCLVAGAAPAVYPAALNGRVTFVTKRGQNPVAEETLVWLEPAAGVKAARRAPTTTQMTTRGKTLLPHVLAVPVGSTVNFPNEDPISHNLFSLTSSNQFDLGLYRAGPGKSHTFNAPGIVNVYCNVHPQMSAVIHVLSTPYFAFADPRGSFTFADVPPGRYDLVAWNEQAGTTKTQVEIGASAPPAAVLTLDSRVYRVSGHANKFGKSYEPPRSKEY